MGAEEGGIITPDGAETGKHAELTDHKSSYPIDMGSGYLSVCDLSNLSL